MKGLMRISQGRTSMRTVQRPAWTCTAHGVPALAVRVLPLEGEILSEVPSGRLKPGIQTFSRFAGLATAIACLSSLPAFANPIGMTVTRGAATTTQNGSQLTVHASQGAVL